MQATRRNAVAFILLVAGTTCAGSLLAFSANHRVRAASAHGQHLVPEHVSRKLVPALADRYHVAAGFLPGFALSEAADRARLEYTFAHLPRIVARSIDDLGLRSHAVHALRVWGAIAYRLAAARPERVTAFLSRNGRADEEALSMAGWSALQKAWNAPTAENRAAIREWLRGPFA